MKVRNSLRGLKARQGSIVVRRRGRFLARRPADPPQVLERIAAAAVPGKEASLDREDQKLMRVRVVLIIQAVEDLVPNDAVLQPERARGQSVEPHAEALPVDEDVGRPIVLQNPVELRAHRSRELAIFRRRQPVVEEVPIAVVEIPELVAVAPPAQPVAEEVPAPVAEIPEPVAVAPPMPPISSSP